MKPCRPKDPTDIFRVIAERVQLSHHIFTPKDKPVILDEEDHGKAPNAKIGQKSHLQNPLEQRPAKFEWITLLLEAWGHHRKN